MTAALFLLTATLTAPDAFESSFQQGLEAYREERYAESAQFFEQLLASRVVDPVVFHNLGNAYYQQGLWAPAIANYERALQQDPTLEGARINLDLALSQAKTTYDKPMAPAWQEALLFWDKQLSYRLVRSVAILCWLLFWFLLALRLFRHFPYQRAITTALLVMAVLSGLSAWTKAHPMALAVAAAESVPVRYGIGENEALRFSLKLGDRVGVERTQQDWLLVHTPNGDRGWAPKSAFVLVGPPYENYKPVAANARDQASAVQESTAEPS